MMTKHAKDERVTPALAEKLKRVRALMKKHTSADATTMYEIAAEVACVKADENKYGSNAVGRLAEEVGLSKARLYDFARVAEGWDRNTFDEELGLCNANDQPLTFSHFIAVAKVTGLSAEQRRAFLDQARDKSLSVRDLTEILQSHASQGSPAATGKKQAFLSFATSARKQAEAKLEEVSRALRDGSPTADEAQAAIGEFEATLSAYQGIVQALRDATCSVERPVGAAA